MVRIINVEPDDEVNKVFLTNSIGQRPIVAAFHMPGCMYCDALKEPWKEFTNMLEKKYSGDETIIAFVHKDVQDDVVQKVKGDMFIGGYPTIVGIKKGGSFEEFKGERSSNSLLKFYKQTCGNKKIKKNRTKKGGSIGSKTAKSPDEAERRMRMRKKRKTDDVLDITKFVPSNQQHGMPDKVLMGITRKTLKRKYDIPKEIVVKKNISPDSSLGSQGHESTKPKKNQKTSKSSGGKRKNKRSKSRKILKK
tara:strand:- start:111 stop:860 length:750 start_codon:yes stop_codon:yes gene_type:complete